MTLVLILIVFFSFSMGSISEPFENYKYNKTYNITMVDSIPLLDGRLDDDCWKGIESIVDFTQVEPFYNISPTENTSVKIIQDEYAIYIGARLFDNTSNQIAQKFVNRDDFIKLSMSDWFSVSIDSHHDHQTGYEFLVNAAGVQFDSFLFDDSDEEMNWDGVWESMVSIDEKGWIVEMRIPFSSLRFSDFEKESTWGLDINRYIHRKNEYIEWVVLPKGTNAGVSKFGHLNNITNTENETSVELMPYVSMGQVEWDDIVLVDPNKEEYGQIDDYANNTRSFFYPRVGLDLKIHLSNNTIFDFTTLPDFGQIESDPADINFTYYDTYFEERRSFFLESGTLFDSPIDLFHSRRIGENPDYEIKKYEEFEDALVLGAAKVTGKTPRGITYGFIGAKTTSPKRNRDMFTLDLNESDNNYMIGRLSKDIFSGNSYLGVTATAFQNKNKESSVISYDGLYNLFNNRLFIDSQIIQSMSDGIYSTGAFLEFEYSAPNLIRFGSSFEYYDPNLDINDVGYLLRNDLIKLSSNIIYHNDKGFLDLGIRNFDIIFNHTVAKNNDNYLLGNIFNLGLKINFKNYGFLDISQQFNSDSYEDRLYAFTEDSLYIDKIGKAPKGNAFQIDLGSDPNYKYYFDFSYNSSNTEIKEPGYGYMLSLGANITEDSDLAISFIKSSNNEKFRFLEVLKEQIEDGLKSHFIYANSKNINKKFTIRYNKFFQNGINIQLYHEYFAQSHSYSNFSELTSKSSYPSSQTEYILLDDFYCDIGDPQLNGVDPCSLNPNDYIYYYPNFNELNFNMILSWEYSKKSNIYFIYKFRKQIVGQEITNYIDFADYIDFLQYKHSETHLSEVLNDQAIYIKIDYWFDF